ncbi:MAG: hypothetical protein AAGK47_04250 [Bacteroidota bacterium]
MKRYLAQLLSDIEQAKRQPPQLYNKLKENIFEWLPREEDEQQAPKKTIEAWTGIQQYALPPVDRLQDNQLTVLLTALKELLAVYNCHFVTNNPIPESVQYRAIRRGWLQLSPMTRFHEHQFRFCNKEQHGNGCHLGDQYCQCQLISDIIFPSQCMEEDWTEADEERFWNRQDEKRKDEGEWLFDLDDDEM